MNATITDNTRAVAFADLKGALSTGGYLQGRGALCKIMPGGKVAYCFTGLVDEICLGTRWWMEASDELVDDYGESQMVSDDRVAFLGLDKTVEPYEADMLSTFAKIPLTEFNDVSRIQALQLLNDYGVDFFNIYEMIERLEWDVR